MKSSLAQCIAGGASTSEIQVRFPEATSFTGSPSKPIFWPKTDLVKYAKHTIKLPQPNVGVGATVGTATATDVVVTTARTSTAATGAEENVSSRRQFFL